MCVILLLAFVAMIAASGFTSALFVGAILSFCLRDTRHLYWLLPCINLAGGFLVILKLLSELEDWSGEPVLLFIVCVAWSIPAALAATLPALILDLLRCVRRKPNTDG